LQLPNITMLISLALLKSIKGVGWILGMMILYEIENIARFPREQDFASYCRLVKSRSRMVNPTATASKRSATPICAGPSGVVVVLML
jgi:transposase